MLNNGVVNVRRSSTMILLQLVCTNLTWLVESCSSIGCGPHILVLPVLLVTALATGTQSTSRTW